MGRKGFRVASLGPTSVSSLTLPVLLSAQPAAGQPGASKCSSEQSHLRRLTLLHTHICPAALSAQHQGDVMYAAASHCRFLCDASSLEFLSKHGFDFNTCIGQGVPYMPVRGRDWHLMQVCLQQGPDRASLATAAAYSARCFVPTG